MANDETIKEVRELLAEKGTIKSQTALRLTLAMQAETLEKLNRHDERIDKLEKDTKQNIEAVRNEVKIVHDASIVLWVQSNPKLAIFLVTFYLILSALVDVREVLAKALGVK